MARQEQKKSLAATAAWPLLVLTAVLHGFFGLSNVAYLFMGVLKPAFGLGAWTAATMGGFQAVAAVVVVVLAARGDLRGAILAVAGSLMLGWLSLLPSVVEQGLDFHGDNKGNSAYVVIAPLIAIPAAALAWRNIYLIAAALIASAMTVVGILFVIAFGIAIAMYGF